MLMIDRDLGTRLAGVGINSVIMLSNSPTRNEVLSRVLGPRVNIEHRKGSTREMDWIEYVDMCKVFGVLPDKVGYQMSTGDSKPQARLSMEEQVERSDTLVVNADTVIQTENLKPIEKPASDWDAYLQLYRLLNSQPYLISTMVSVFGLGNNSNVSTHRSHDLPTARLVSNIPKKIKMTMDIYKSGKFPIVPGGVSHHIDEIAEDVYVYEGRDRKFGLDIDPNMFFQRKKYTTQSGSDWLMSDHYGDIDGTITRNVGSSPTFLRRRKYTPEDQDLTELFLGAPALAFIDAISGWIDKVERKNIYHTNPTRNNSYCRNYIRSIMTV